MPDRQSLVEFASTALPAPVVVMSGPTAATKPFQETPVREPSLTRAFLKIQEGCDDYRTYRIVPYARGPSRSRPLQSILEEARSLVGKARKSSSREPIGLYGKDLSKAPDEKNLSKALDGRIWERPRG